jgi:hypothetical protein
MLGIHMYRFADCFAKRSNPALPSWFPKNEFFPLNSVDGPDGDIFWKPFMSNALTTMSPIDDPLYSAHKKVQLYDKAIKKNQTAYRSDYPIRGVGCVQHVSRAQKSNGNAY